MAEATTAGGAKRGEGVVDIFGDVLFTPATLPQLDADELQAWLEEKRAVASRGIWLDLTGDVDAMGRVLPPALKAGFTMHRASGGEQLMLRGWSAARSDADPCPIGAYTVHIVDCAVVRRDGAVLMVKQTYDPSGKYTFPGGFVDPQEPLEVAARREVLEETGIPAAPVAILHTRTTARLPDGHRFGLSAVTHLVLVRPDDLAATLEGPPPGETTPAGEIAECSWVPRAQWADPAWAGEHANDHLQVSLAQLASMQGAAVAGPIADALAAATCTTIEAAQPGDDGTGVSEGKSLPTGSYAASTCIPWSARHRDLRIYAPTVVSGDHFVWW